MITTSRYVESVRDGALGVELFDALRGTRVLSPLHVWREDAAPPPADKGWPYLDKRTGYLHGLYYSLSPSARPLRSPVSLRFFDATRRYAPRRLSFNFLPLADANAQRRPRLRLRPVSFYPGAAYPLDACATGLRGRVMRDGAPVRWARVQATRGNGANPLVVGRAHGDDRGEFLLIVGPDASPAGDLPEKLDIDVTVFAPAVPDPDTYVADPMGDEIRDLIADPRRVGGDPLGDLVQEDVEALTVASDPDPTSILLGEEIPTGYAQLGAAQRIELVIGQIVHGVPDFTP